MTDTGILELCGWLAAITAGVGGPIAAFRWALTGIKAMLTDSEARTKASLDDHGHKIANLKSVTDALGSKHADHLLRTQQLESNFAHMKEGQDRIEGKLQKIEDMLIGMLTKQRA